MTRWIVTFVGECFVVTRRIVSFSSAPRLGFGRLTEGTAKQMLISTLPVNRFFHQNVDLAGASDGPCRSVAEKLARIRIVGFLTVLSIIPVQLAATTDQRQEISHYAGDWVSDFGQVYTAKKNGEITSVHTLVTPRGNRRSLGMTIQPVDKDGVPTGEILAESWISSSNFTLEEAQWAEFRFASPYRQTIGETLALVYVLGSQPSPNGWFDFHYATEDPHPDSYLYYIGTVGIFGKGYQWTDRYLDLTFEVRVREVPVMHLKRSNSGIRISASEVNRNCKYTLRRIDLGTGETVEELNSFYGSAYPVEWEVSIPKQSTFYRLDFIDHWL